MISKEIKMKNVKIGEVKRNHKWHFDQMQAAWPRIFARARSQIWLWAFLVHTNRKMFWLKHLHSMYHVSFEYTKWFACYILSIYQMNQDLRHETCFKRLCVNHKQNHRNCTAEAENLVLEKIFMLWISTCIFILNA